MNKKYKWVVLACFALAAGMSQLLWLNFAPILSQIEGFYSITESKASLLILVFPLIYVALSIHAGSITDRKGYRFTLLFGTLMMSIFASLRIYIFDFNVMLAAQIGIAIAQPYIVNSISKLVLDWFEKEHEAIATGLGTMGMFIGMALGMALTPVLFEALGFAKSMFVFASVSWLVFFMCLLWVWPNPASQLVSRNEVTEKFSIVFFKIIRNSQLVLVFLISFLGLGYFNGLTTWLEAILAPNGINSVQSGVIGGVLIAGGIFGSAIIPAISDHFKNRKKILVICLAAALLTIYPLTESHHYSRALVFAVIHGFFMLPSFALLLEMCSELSGPKLVGASTGILMLAGNAGGVLMILLMEWIKGDSNTFSRSILFLIFAMIMAIFISLKMKETYKIRNT